MIKILYVVEDTKQAQFRYSVENIKQALEKSKKYRIEWCLKTETKKIRSYLKEVELVVVLRQAAKNDTIMKLIEEASRLGKVVLFDLDDLVFDYRDLLLLMWSTKSKNVFYWLGYFWGVRRIAKKVDGFITTNNFLGEKLERSFKKPYAVIPNSLNQEQIKVAEQCLKEKRKKDKKGFKIGYFSGSPTHTRDFELVESEILRFLDNHDEVELEIVGYMKLSERAKKYEKKGRIKCEPPVDYLELERKIARVDVNIAPLVINDFTNCKSELKFFEAGVVETTTIASPTYAFKKAIKDGENGFLALPGEWYDKLEYLYRHPKENQKIAKRAYEYSLKHYCGEEILKEIEKAYDDFLGK